MKKIGMLTSGGDCQGLNAALYGVAKSLYLHYGDNIKIYGIQDGYRGLINGEYKLMKPEDFSGIMCIGGTILGTSRQPFKLMKIVDEKSSIDKVKAMKENYKKMGLDCLVILGGNGTHKSANMLSEEGLNVVTLPKTIDNDLWGTDVTFGFQSAVDIATYVIDCIHTTATSHGRVFLVELMGHKAGWLTLEAGIAGGADVILIPEIPYSINSVVDALKRRNQIGKKFSIIAVAEGAISKEDKTLSKKALKAKRALMEQSTISYQIADEITKLTGQEVRVTVPGHFQRGGAPCALDRRLSIEFGSAAANLIINNDYGKMVGLKGNNIINVPLSEVAGKLKQVPLNSPIIKSARNIGICFGD